MEAQCPRSAPSLRRLLKDPMIYWTRETYKSVIRMIGELERGTNVSWVDTPPTQQLAYDRDITTTILHAYEKYQAFIATGQDYNEVDDEL